MSITDSAPPPGHNNPPPATVGLQDRITTLYSTELARLAQLEETLKGVPEKIEDDATAGKVGDALKLASTAIKAADGAREGEKEPFLTAGKQVDAIFKIPMDSLKAVAGTVKLRLTVYLDAKKERERLAREDEARKAREAAEKKAAEEAEKKAREEAAADAAADAASRAQEARENKDEAEQRRLDAEVAVANAKAKRASARRDKDDAALSAAEEDLKTAQAELDAAKKELREKREADRQAKLASEKAARDQAEAAKETKAATSATGQAERQADRVEKRATAPSAELSQTRGADLGSVSSLAKHWTFDIRDRSAIPAAVLWPYFSEDEINAAVARAVRGGVREMPGVRIYQTETARTV